MIKKVVNQKGRLVSELYLPPPQNTSNESGLFIYSIYYSPGDIAQYTMIQYILDTGPNIKRGYARYYNDIHNLCSMMISLGFVLIHADPTDKPNLIVSFI